MAIRTITFVKDLDFENAILRAMKWDKFMCNDNESLNAMYCVKHQCDK